MRSDTPIGERFWSKVAKGPECWVWTGMTNSGRGQFILSRRPKNVRVPAQRWAWEQEHGAVPEGLTLVPQCETALCVRPSHWRPGTLSDLPFRSEKAARERFWSLVPQTSSGCWEWAGGIGAREYGQFSYQGRTLLAHRMAWTFSHGEIPAGMEVCHRCDNPPCCRPDHLFLGTPADNSADMVAKGRSFSPAGTLHGQAKLTAAQVREIRARYAAGGVTYRSLSAEYGVTAMGVRAVVLRKSYRNVA